MFIAALFTIGKVWKEAGASTDEWKDKEDAHNSIYPMG